MAYGAHHSDWLEELDRPEEGATATESSSERSAETPTYRVLAAE